MKARPFLRWCGGKTQLLPRLLEHVPSSYGAYHEPFLGGGAMYFALQPKEAYLGDVNHRLINAYKCISRELQETVWHLRRMERSSECYYEQRTLLNEERFSSLAESAARFIYLNKTCFNGLWRENGDGAFNVPYGGDRKGPVIDEQLLLECSILLRRSAWLKCEGFEAVGARAQPGDLVYFDPPYVPVKTESFVDYVADGFGAVDQVRLRDLARVLKGDGVHVILSNSDTTLTRELYDGFEIREVVAKRSINSDGAGRSGAKELIIT